MSAGPSLSARVAACRLWLRTRAMTLAANWRLNRVDRLLEAGHGREARRVIAAVKRDVHRHRERLAEVCMDPAPTFRKFAEGSRCRALPHQADKGRRRRPFRSSGRAAPDIGPPHLFWSPAHGQHR